MLPHSDLLQLKRRNTPTIYNGWEQITRHDIAAEGFNLEDSNECNTLIPAAFGAAAREKFGKKGEW